MLFDSITDAIGHTPLVRLRMPSAPEVTVYAKLELQNLFGMKDRVGRNIVLSAKYSGALVDGAPIVESSSGTMALGVALVGRSLGHEVHIVTDPRIDRVTLAKLHSLGCHVHVVQAMTSHGWQSARLERLAQLMAGLPGAFWPQQYGNPDNPGAYRALASEIVTDLGHVDVLVGSVGSGGSLCGSARALRELLPELSVIGVDCVGSALFDQPDQPKRLQSGLGNSLLPKNLDRRLIQEVHWLNDHEAFTATRALAAEQQIFAGNTSGSVYRVLRDVAARSAPGTRIVGIFPDRGDRYADTVYSDEYCQAHDLGQLTVAATPAEVEYGTVVGSWSRAVNRGAAGVRQHLLFVEANTTGTGMLALRTANDLGLRPVLLTSKPERYAGLGEQDCEIVVCETNSLRELRGAIQDRFRRDELAGVASTSDFYAPMVAEIAAWLGLPGNPVSAMATCRDKGLMRETLRLAGVGQPRFALVREGCGQREVAGAVGAVGLPCVVKPVDDSGSRGVLLCGTAAEAAAQIQRILDVRVNVRGMPASRTVLVEEYLDGPEVSVEMFSRDGEHTCVGLTAKTVSGHPYFIETQHVFPAALPRETVRVIEDTVRAALRAAGVRMGATHTEVKLTGHGPAIVEINPRLAGGMIPELIRLATGTDLLEQQLRAAAAQPADLAPRRSAHAGIRFLLATEPGELIQVAGVTEAAQVPGVTAVRVTGQPGALVRPPEDAYDRVGYVIAAGQDPDAVRTALAGAAARIRVDVAARSPAGARS
jgi:S-sulfo-L-cysteine synthase (3-phospho-L-serine-dependent)